MEISKKFKINENNFTLKDNLRFILPSILGVILFMIPIKYNGDITIPIAIFSGMLVDLLGESLIYIITGVLALSAVLTFVGSVLKPKFITNNKLLSSLFVTSPLWLTCRVLGGIFVILTAVGIGPEIIISGDTGAFVLHDLLTVLFSIFLFAGLFLPLLLNFGLLELFGSLLTKIMRPVFKLPGRSSIDCITSWLGDGTLGIMLTNKQYEEGFYTQREAATISTTFSAVSITFSLVVINTVGLGNMFVPFYLSVTVAGIVAAVIIPRIYPLAKKKDVYYDGSTEKVDESIPEGYTSFSWGYEHAINKAKQNSSVKEFFVAGGKNVLDMWLGVLPVVMCMATMALIIATYTPVFKILGLPFYPILQLLQVPEALAASQTLVVGFADMLLPSIVASGSIQSEMTRFIVAAVSVTQLIYMSEVGGVLLGSKIPVNIKELLIIFVERTLITLPVIVLIANLIF